MLKLFYYKTLIYNFVAQKVRNKMNITNNIKVIFKYKISLKP